MAPFKTKFFENDDDCFVQDDPVFILLMVRESDVRCRCLDICSCRLLCLLIDAFGILVRLGWDAMRW